MSELAVLRCLCFRYNMTVMKAGEEGRTGELDERFGSCLPFRGSVTYLSASHLKQDVQPERQSPNILDNMINLYSKSSHLVVHL